jgi:hypothetical protein
VDKVEVESGKGKMKIPKTVDKLFNSNPLNLEIVTSEN